MPISLPALCHALSPSNTALLLGAGASVPSGSPSGKGLSHQLWKQVAGTDPQSDDLIETASILERRFGRRSLVDAVVAAFAKLRPTGGLSALPKFDWKGIYSTNFDRLIEAAFKEAGAELTVVRSNYDFSAKEARSGQCLYKIHGCITQDRSLGDKASMILTEQDYEDFAKYRQAMFSLLQTSMLTGDVLVIGQSLRDQHLNDLVRRVLHFKQEGTPGEVYVLVYERDDLRAPLLEDRGAKIAFGGIDEFVHALTGKKAPEDVRTAPVGAKSLPMALVATVIDVSHARTLGSNVTRMFNGGAATYADVRAGVTFERAQHSALAEALSEG